MSDESNSKAARYRVANFRIAILSSIVMLLAVIFYLRAVPTEPSRTGEASRRVTLLTVNDIYRLDGVADDKVGGLHRLRTLRKWIERDAPNVILLHAGDFLSPSLFSRNFKGAQMIDVMNHLDGDGPAFDRRMLVTFGNHEFDDSRCNQEPAPLNARLDESKFLWLASNLDFSNCPSMKSLLSHPNVRKDGIVLEVGGVKVGFFGIGLTPDKTSGPKYPQFGAPPESVQRSIDYLRSNGAEVVVALTHLPREDDEALIRDYAAKGLDLVVGGHDHTNMVLTDKATGVARGFKADSNARSAWRIDLHLLKNAKPRIEAQLISLNEAILPDPDIAKLADTWFTRASALICADRAKTRHEPEKPDCLRDKIGWTRGKIELEESDNRTQETGFGDWLADLMIRKTGADVAIINSGNLGLDETMEPGAELRLKHIFEIVRFDDVVAVRKFPAKMVCSALEHGFKIPGSGAWPHVGGVEVEIKTSADGKNAAAVKRFLKHPLVNCDRDTEITVASVPFLLCGNDGYPFKAPDPKPGEQCEKTIQNDPFNEPPETVPEKKRPRQTLRDIIEAEVRSAGTAGIKPKADGRLTLAD